MDEENRRLALAWLPFVDMLIYVVSPERYRDDVGWRVLQERAERHGWMFVVNRWDEGSSEQPRDFETILQRAGFERPVVLCTCGIEDLRRRPERDDFPRIESTIQRLLAEHGQQELERLGHRARLLDLHEFVKGAQQALGTAEQWQALEREAARLLSAATDSICAGLAPDQRVAAERLAAIVQPESRPVLEQVRAAVTPLLVKETSRPTASLTLSVDAELAALAEQAWPLWAQERAAEFLDGIDVAAAHAGLRSPPLRVALQPVVTDLATEVSRATERAAREALAPAGIPWRHGARRAAGFLTKAGPVAVLIWIAVLAFLGFYRATLGATGWLGTDFAVHAAVLLLISWGLPLAVWWWLRPDAGPALFSSQQRALRRVLEQQWGAARAALAAAAQSAGSLAQEVDALKADIERFVQRGAASTAPGIAPLVSTGIKEKV
ncbi:MAG: hypothetical protein HY269_04095 [Deltaproteobacteria bacterium]|nr:hypothetical protein [Deltaproteobacteria bacterium]